jgi:formamidopyrimidine-DNA glycosylase
MPELPEVETICRGLQRAVAGRRLLGVVQRRPDLRFPFPPLFAERLDGRRVLRVARRAKYILAHLEGGLVWLTHLGMSGRMTIGEGAPPSPRPHDHVLMATDDGQHLVFTDPRRFGFMDLVEERDLAAHPRLAGLGIEPLDGEVPSLLDGPHLETLLRGRQTPLKAALLDQRLIAGLGNIYVCEALFRAGLSPFRHAGTVAGVRAERLAAAIREVLQDAIAAGGSSLRDYVQASGELGYFQHRWAVYGREGEPCPGCDCNPARTGGVQRSVQAGRSTFHCTSRQR